MHRTFYIQGMAVLPKGRGQKIGYQLLETIESYAKKNNCQELLLNTTPYLKKAISLYEKFGFKIINEPPYDLYKTPLFNMKKRFSNPSFWLTLSDETKLFEFFRSYLA